MPTRYDEVLDVGDRLAAALLAGDLPLAEAILGERARLIDALAEGGDRPLPAHVERFRRQDARLDQALRDGLRGMAAAAGRTAAAADAYQARPAHAGHLDTGRR